MVTQTANYTVTFNTDTGKVRTVAPPEEFDDKGEIKKLTAADLKRLKGDDPAEKKMPGYKADFSELQVNDVVQVALAAWKPNTPKKGDKGKDKEPATEDPAKEKMDGKDGKWVTVTTLTGTVTRIDQPNTENSSPKITVKAQGQVRQPNNTPAPKESNTTIEPDKAQATIILIAQRPRSGMGVGDGKK
jgi:hypothetical protein